VLSSATVNTLRRVTVAVVASFGLALPPVAQGQQAVPLERELAARIAAAVVPLTEVQLVVADESAGPGADRDRTERELTAALRDRGLQFVANAGERTATVRVDCSDSLTERVCSADVQKADGRAAVVVSRPRTPPASGPSASPVTTISLQPVFSQRDRILDLVELNEQQLLVLDIATLTLYQRNGDDWKSTQSVSVHAGASWPRDVRGRITVTAQAVEVFLPGVSCRGRLERFEVQCAETPAAEWPVGVPGSTLAAGRNYFTAPRTAPFFSAAPLDARARPGWLIATLDGKWQLLGEALDVRQSFRGLSDDVAGITTACGTLRQVIAVLQDHGGAGFDAVRAFEVTERDVKPSTPPAGLTGAVTALWTLPRGQNSLVVVENRDAQRYEAFRVGLSCAR
jgi:hypothetical protein